MTELVAEPGPASVEQPVVMEAVRAVANALSDGRPLDDLLHLVAEWTCTLVGVRRCSIHLREGNSRLFRGRVGHADHDIDRSVRKLVAGLPADRFTHEIVETRRPVLLSNATADPRAIRSAMRHWEVRSVLGVPMVLAEQVVGIMYLDNEQEPRDFRQEDQDVAAAFAELAATAVVQTQLTADLRESLATIARQNDQLKRAARMEERLATRLLEGSSVGEIGRAVATLTGKPCAIYDASFTTVAEALPEGAADRFPRVLDAEIIAIPAVAEALAGPSERGGGRTVGPFPQAGLAHRLLIVPIDVQEERWGYLVVAECRARLDSADALLARRAGRNIALQLGATRRASGDDWRVGESLVTGLIRGDADAVSLQQRADVLGARLDIPRVVCFVRGTAARSEERPHPSPRVLAAAFADRSEGPAIGASVAEGTVVLIGVPGDLGRKEQAAWAGSQAAAALDELAPDGGLLAAISPVCVAAAEHEAAFDDARQVMQCIEGFVRTGGNHVLAADDLGPGQLFLSAAGGDRGRRFAHTTLGPLLDPHDTKSAELLATLDAFSASSHNVRLAAERLFVHKNTVRYRLARVLDLTGLDVIDDAEAQLAVHLALIVLRLGGELPGDAQAVR
jgi:sugar diacid utilization regulator